MKRRERERNDPAKMAVRNVSKAKWRAKDRAARAAEAALAAGGVAVARSLHTGGASGSVPYSAGENDCVICMDERKSVVLLPCKHMCVCSACAEQLTRVKSACCPVCRTVVADVLRGVFG